MKELIKKFLLKAGLRKEDDPLSAIRTEANAEAPVSYTHLDVYKRQTLY